MRNSKKLMLALKQSSRYYSIGDSFGFTPIAVANKINNGLTSNYTNNKALLSPINKLPLMTDNSVHTTPVGLKEVGFSEYQKLQENGVTVIDVREIHEIEKNGTVAGSLNIPLKEIDEALGKSADDFKLKYGRPKPAEGEAVMFLCQKGGRSLKARDKAIQLGYSNALSYKGGWEDFSKNEIRKDLDL